MNENLSFAQYSFLLEVICSLDLGVSNSSNCSCDTADFPHKNGRAPFDPRLCEVDWNISAFLSALEYHDYNDEMWSGYPETILIPVLFGTVLLVGLIGNGVVVYVVARSWAQKTVTNLYFLNLAIADLLVLVFCAPFTASIYLLPHWPFGSIICKLVNYFMIVSTAASVMTLMAMGFDRYQAVVRPVQTRAYRTVKKTLTVLTVIWFLNLSTSIPILFMSRLLEFYDFGGTQEYCLNYFPEPIYKKMYTVVVFLLYYCLPLLFIALCYFLMAKNLRAHVKPGNQRPTGVKGIKTKHHHSKSRRRLSKLVLAVVTTFAVCWLPIHCVHLKIDFSPPTYSYSLYIVRIVAHLFSYANSAINPCLYAFMSENFRQCLKDAFRCFQDERNGESLEGGPAGQKNDGVILHSSTPSTGQGQFDLGTQLNIPSETTPASSSSLTPSIKAFSGEGEGSRTAGGKSESGFLRPSSVVEMESVTKAFCRHTDQSGKAETHAAVSPLDPEHSKSATDSHNALELSTTTVTRLTIQITTADTTV